MIRKTCTNQLRGAAILTFVVLVLGGGGCIVDDNAGGHGQSNVPAASVPDSGSPVRRESAAKTFKDAENDTPADADLKVAPPPVQ